MGVLAGITALVDLLKKAGILRDREAEVSAQQQFLASTSGPLYGFARVLVIFASIWDIFFNRGAAWAATGMPQVLELMPVFWLFFGPEISSIAVGLLKQSKIVQPAQPTSPIARPTETPPENRREADHGEDRRVFED